MTRTDELLESFAALGDPRKARQRPAAERLAGAVDTDPWVRERLVETLEDVNPRRRWGAAFALGISARPGAEAVPALIAALGDRDGDVRWAATRVLTSLAAHEPAVVDSLGAALASASALQRKMALYGLRDAGAGDLGAICERLGDEDPKVRMAAMSAVAALAVDGRVAASRIMVLFDDPDPGVRRAAAATVGRLADVSLEAVQALETLMVQSSDPILVRTVRAALIRLGVTTPSRP